MNSRSSKRTRLNNGGAYRDSVPMETDFDDIQSREGRLRRVGGNHNVFTAPLARTTHQELSDWTNTTAWAPMDDPDFALDPNDGAWYDEVVERDAMQANGPDAQVQRKKYHRSKVSVCFLFIYHISILTSGCRNVPMLCGWNYIVRRT